jgi:hypothetical protein
MQFRARLAGVSGTSPRSADSPNVISVKLEPQQLPWPDWLFERLGCWLTVDVADGPESLGPLFEVEDA